MSTPGANILTVSKGTDADFQLTLVDSQGTVITTYTNSDTLSASVWDGDGRAVDFTPTVAWIAPTQGTYKLAFVAASTSSLAVGRYPVRVTLTRASDSKQFVAWNGWLELEASPGSDTALSVYATYQDALVYYPHLEDLQSKLDQARFQTHFHEARVWLEDLIQRKWEFNAMSGLIDYGYITSIYPVWTTGGFSKQMQDWLDANYLMLRPRIIEITAKRALGNILQSAVSPTSDKWSVYQKLGYRFLVEANELVKGTSAMFDINQDGYPEFGVQLGTATIRG